MKSEVVITDDVRLPYPYMGIAFDELVVLFTEFGKRLDYEFF